MIEFIKDNLLYIYIDEYRYLCFDIVENYYKRRDFPTYIDIYFSNRNITFHNGYIQIFIGHYIEDIYYLVGSNYVMRSYDGDSCIYRVSNNIIRVNKI